MNPLTTPHPRRPVRRHHALLARTQGGATAIEFALVFPLFFMIFYGIVTFSLILVAQQNLTLAASEGARAALNWQSNQSVSDALNNRGAAACQTAALMATTLVRAMTCTHTSAPCGPNGTMDCVSVQLNFNYQSNPPVPILPLMAFMVPANLTSSATVQLNPENIQ